MVSRDKRGATASSQLAVSADQRAAFLAALGRCGKAVDAATECGLVLAKLYRARRKFADFAADWDDVLAARPVQSRPGGETWSTATQARFFEVLGKSGSPAQAAAAVGRVVPLVEAAADADHLRLVGRHRPRALHGHGRGPRGDRPPRRPRGCPDRPGYR